MTEADGGHAPSSLKLHNATLEVNADGRDLEEVREAGDGVIDTARQWAVMDRLRMVLCNIFDTKGGAPLRTMFYLGAAQDGEQPRYVFGCRPGEEELVTRVLDAYKDAYRDFDRDAIDVESTEPGHIEDGEVMPDYAKASIDERIKRLLDNFRGWGYLKFRVRNGDAARRMEDGQTFVAYVAQKVAELAPDEFFEGKDSFQVKLFNQTKETGPRYVDFYIDIPVRDGVAYPEEATSKWSGYDPNVERARSS